MSLRQFGDFLLWGIVNDSYLGEISLVMCMVTFDNLVIIIVQTDTALTICLD